MQTIYKNESSAGLRWLMLVAGVVLLALTVLDYFALWPLFSGNQQLDVALLLVGSVLALIGFKEVAGYIQDISVDDKRNFVIRRRWGTVAVAGDGIRTLTLYASGKDAKRMLLATDRGSFTFPMKGFPAERFAETIKAINPAATIDHQA